MNQRIDAFELDYWEIKKLKGKFLKEKMMAIFRNKEKVKWEKERKLDLILAK